MIVSRFKRYQILAIGGGLMMAAGVFLMSSMNASTPVGIAIAFTIISGLGMGPFFSVTTLAAQNVLPRASLGVGTAAVRYLGQIGAALGTAIVGTVVNSSLSANLSTAVPSEATKQIPAEGLKMATNPQVLMNAQYHDTVDQTWGATTTPGLLDQVFAALQNALTTAIQHGFITVLVFCLLLIVGTFFLKDVPMYEHSNGSNNEA
jgi:hypothetical protein